ncbi:MAG: ABC transporter substrate-binding protein, partial [Chloroflexi bacterium]|nr:ABC transporter substrate-binding protein [Chloroflexota bacterium]
APLAPFSTAAWAAEYSKVKDCDIVVLATITNTSATLINDFRSRGYKGVLLGNSLAIMASWTLLRSGSLQNMDGVLGVQGGPVWSDVSAAMTIASQVEPEFQPNDPTVHTSTNWMSGVVYGYMLADCIRRAAAKVGAENVDAAAMDDAFQTVNLDMGWGENWQWYPEHVYHRMLRIMKYNLASDTLTTEYAWHYPPSWAPV